MNTLGFGRVAKWLGLALILSSALAVALYLISKSVTWQAFGEIVHRVDTREKVVALTFDDGPKPGATEELLRLLDTQGVKASFFLVGKSLERNPQQAKMIAEAGHQLGNHSYSHSRMVFFDYRRVAEELETTEALIRQTGYRGEILFRPPYGKKLFNLPRYLADNRITTVTWDIAPETFDGPMRRPEEISSAILEQVRPGSIILLHPMNGYRETVQQALPIVIGNLRQRGFRFVTLSELLAEAQ